MADSCGGWPVVPTSEPWFMEPTGTYHLAWPSVVHAPDQRKVHAYCGWTFLVDEVEPVYPMQGDTICKRCYAASAQRTIDRLTQALDNAREADNAV